MHLSLSVQRIFVQKIIQSENFFHEKNYLIFLLAKMTDIWCLNRSFFINLVVLLMIPASFGPGNCQLKMENVPQKIKNNKVAE